MPTVVLVYGLCGSGKSHTAKTYAEAKYVVLDESPDFVDIDENCHLSRVKYSRLRDLLLAGSNCVVVEFALCQAAIRAVVEGCLGGIPDLQIKYVCFEADLESANWNCWHRTDKSPQDPIGHICINRRAMPYYSIPDGAERKRIERVKADPDVPPIPTEYLADPRPPRP